MPVEKLLHALIALGISLNLKQTLLSIEKEQNCIYQQLSDSIIK